MSVFSKVFGFFSVYADPFEKEADLFLKKIRQRSRQDLQSIIQKDLVKLTVFLEYKFKGYKRLKKRYRKKLYKNAVLIAEGFIHFFETHQKAITEKQKTLNIPDFLKQDEKFTFILAIMAYLALGERLVYEEAATFSKLLRNPTQEKLVGDCNQITTLYVFLYSLRYPVTDLQVKILPGHICLHYKEVDIETTSASLAHYEDYTFLSSVEEIVAANLLDVSDPGEKQFKINPNSVLKAAELAYQFSSHRSTVKKNLFIAYHNLALYYTKQKNFSNATLFANKSGNTKLQKNVVQMEAVDHLKARRYKKALEKFRRIGDVQGEKACYQNELADLFEKTKSLKLVRDFKNHKAALRRMKELALKLNNQKVVDFVNDILKKLT